MITINWSPFVVFRTRPKTFTAINSKGPISENRFGCAVRVLIAVVPVHSLQLVTVVN